MFQRPYCSLSLPLRVCVCVVEPRQQDDADQPDRLPEWKECQGVHERPVAFVAQCPGEHRWHTLCLPGAEEGGNQAETGNVHSL